MFLILLFLSQLRLFRRNLPRLWYNCKLFLATVFSELCRKLTLRRRGRSTNVPAAISDIVLPSRLISSNDSWNWNYSLWEYKKFLVWSLQCEILIQYCKVVFPIKMIISNFFKKLHRIRAFLKPLNKYKYTHLTF